MTMQLAHWYLACALAAAPFAATQTAPQQSTSAQKSQAGTAKVDPDDLPVSLDRIQRALAKTPMLRFDAQDRPVFRVQVFGDKPTIDDILGPDWNKGPVPYGSLTHQEFLKMVTPEDVQGYAAFSNGEGVTVAATSLLLQWTLQKAIRKYQETRDEHLREEARKEVLEALDALEKARAKAGKPPKPK
jgi:hypothetical protein